MMQKILSPTQKVVTHLTQIFHDTIYNVAPFEVDLLVSFVHLASDIAFHVC